MYKIGTMTFGNSLKKYQFEDVVQVFTCFWEHNTSKPFKDTEIKSLKMIYLYLQVLQLTQSRYYILLHNRWDNCSPIKMKMLDNTTRVKCCFYGKLLIIEKNIITFIK